MSSVTSASLRSRKPKKAKMLVVDDEPDNLDLLYRTFRREFQVLRAESGQQALDVLSEHGEVAVIISDQRMPEMKGTEFLSKTVPQFPDTVRIILTGFTDVEDLVQAINAGQVYRYITKPWDPEELKQVVQRATETYELLKQRAEAILQFQRQHQLVSAIADIAQSSVGLEATLTTIAESICPILEASSCAVHGVTDQALGDVVGTAGSLDPTTLKQDPLVEHAIAQQTPQEQVDSTAGSAASPDETVRATYVVPVVLQEAVVAVLYVQWAQPQLFTDNMRQLMALAAQQTGLVLFCRQVYA